MLRVVIYLRKSRADLEAEARGEGETLAKHKKILLKFAKENDLTIVAIYEEIESGESIIHRPKMLQLLKEIEQGLYDAVLVMDIDRLGRGNMQEQGLILETLKKSNTRIITPRKTYDLQDEWDEEYSEFEAFMARKELKLITRRLQRGRTRAIEDGNYLSPLPPYGYLIEQKGKGNRYLIPHPEQADIAKMIFRLYTAEGIGANKIANELNALGLKTYTGKAWQGSSVLTIIKNPVYAGYVRWKMKEIKKTAEKGKKRVARTRDKDDWLIVKGKHEALISEEIYEKAQEILKGRYHVPYQLENGITNPLAGLLRCDFCGSSMILRPYQRQLPHIMCYNRHCCNKSARAEYVEKKLLLGLRQWLDNYKAEWETNKPDDDGQDDTTITIKRKALQDLERELQELEKQKGNLFDLLERGIYDDKTYLERSQNLSKRILNCQASIEHVKGEIELEGKKETARKNVIPKVEHVLDLYDKTDDPAEKNNLLKSVLEKAVYRKEKKQVGDNFTLILYPKL